MRGLTHVGLARYMDTIVGCDASTRHKPDPEPVRIALHRLGCAPEDAIFVGDSVHDVLAGNAAGRPNRGRALGRLQARRPGAWQAKCLRRNHFGAASADRRRV